MTGQDNSGPAVATTLRAIAAWLESHPEIQPHEIYGYRVGRKPILVRLFGLDAERMGQIVQDLGGKWEKDGDDALFYLRQSIAPGAVLELIGARERVCERVVTGTTTVTEPDPEALAQVPTVTREVETYEWRCESLLERAEATS